MRRVLALTVLALGVALAAWLLWPEPVRSDEELLREAVEQMARRATEKDVSGVVEYVSDRYRGEAGDKQDLKRMLAGYIFRSDWVTALPANVQVLELDGARAKVSLVALLVRGPAKSASEVAPESVAGAHYIEAEFAKEPEGWRVVGATRRDANVVDWVR